MLKCGIMYKSFYIVCKRCKVMVMRVRVRVRRCGWTGAGAGAEWRHGCRRG